MFIVCERINAGKGIEDQLLVHNFFRNQAVDAAKKLSVIGPSSLKDILTTLGACRVSGGGQI